MFFFIYRYFALLVLGSITPILKTGDPTNVFNYHPITIHYHIVIIFETIVFNNIKLAVNHILFDERYGLCQEPPPTI